jgi:GxxExxY protein
MGRELIARGIEFKAEVPLPVFLKESRLSSSFRADLICFGDIVVELKAISHTGRADMAQVINYLRASRLSKGPLINFGATSLQFRRISL